MSIGIEFVLRANTAAFTRGVAAAEGRLQSLKKALRFAGAGGLASSLGIGAVISGFAAATKAAQSMRDELVAAKKAVPPLVEGAAGLADSFDSAAESVKRWSVNAIGALTEVGATARRAIQGVTKEQEDAARKLARSTERDAIAAEKRLKEAQEANSPEKRAEAERKLGDLRRENAMRASDDEGKIILLQMRRLELEKERDKFGEGTIWRLEKEAELLKLGQQIDEQRAEAAEKKAKADKEIYELGQKTWELTAERDDIMKEEATARADRILPSIEDLAARATENEQARAGYGVGATGSLISALDPNDPALRAKRALELEQQARDAALSADPVQRLQMAPQFQAEAEELRSSLAGSVQSRDVDLSSQFKKALEETNSKLDEVVGALEGLIKSQ